MHKYVWKAKSRIFSVVTFCTMMVYLAVTNNINLDVKKQTTVGILFPFTTTTDYVNKFRQSVRECRFKIYRPYKLFERTRVKMPNTSKLKEFKGVVNSLAAKSLRDDIDYLVIFLDESSLQKVTVDEIMDSVKKLKEQIVSDVGVVIAGDMNVHTSDSHFITVHKSHMDIFNQFFPNKIKSTSALMWLKDVYEPYHVTEYSENKPHFGKFSIPYQFRDRFKGGDLIKERNKVNEFILSMNSVSIISYSLFGSDNRYLDGARANSRLFKTIYPGWKMWIYHDNTVPLDILWDVCNVDNVTCINMTESNFINRMTWRFLVASVPFVSRYIIRDIDSRLSLREKAAVDEWIVSGKKFHVMRDHPSHSAHPISGGMWGGTRKAIPHIEQLLKGKNITDKYMEDMDFLKDIVWKIANTSVFQHDSFTCQMFGGGHPFPSKRIGLEHVGSVFINEKMRKFDTDILKNIKPPAQCVPE